MYPTRNKAKEAIDSSNLVDIHNIISLESFKDYDVLIIDVDYDTLASGISNLLDTLYLLEAMKEKAKKVPENFLAFSIAANIV